MPNALLVEPQDTVVVAIEDIHAGETISYLLAGREVSLPALEDITIYHKAAVCDIPEGAPVVKYGEHIGLASAPIRAGAHVHTHNVAGHREDLTDNA